MALLSRFIVGLVIGSAFLSSGCATVAVFENVAETEIQLTKPQSELHKASMNFCQISRDAGWANGESNFSALMKIWGGTNEIGEDYWEHLTQFDPSASEVVEQVGFDITNVTASLREVNEMAQALLPSHGAEQKPENSDVREFERVLIHAGQARETFAASFLRVKKMDDQAFDDMSPVDLLGPLDAELELSRSIANGLAASRMSEALAMLEDTVS